MTAPSIALSKRPATLTNLNPRAERHGEDAVPACDISLDGVALKTADEINALLGDAYAYRSLFTEVKGTWEPALPMFDQMRLKGSFEEATAVLTCGGFGQGYEITLTDVKVARLKLEPLAGGAATLSLQLQVSDIEPADVGRLVARLQAEVSVEIREGKLAVKSDRQIDLPINTFGDGEKKADGEPAKKGRGRRAPASTH